MPPSANHPGSDFEASTKRSEMDERTAISDACSMPKPHMGLWFEDGSIVLATDVHLYRLHKSVLANYSTVFKDMLELSNGEGAMDTESTDTLNRDSWEGMPLVKMAGDSDENVYHLLMTLYNRNFYRANKPTTFPVISSLLFMTSKYDIPIIRSEVIEHLESHNPSNVTQLGKHNIKNLFPDDNSEDGSNPDEFDFKLLTVALQSNVEILLPMLYYECAVKPLGEILRISKKFNLGGEEIEKIIIGREKLSKWSYEFGVQALAPHRRCNNNICWGARAEVLVQWMNVHRYDPPDFPRQTLPNGIACFGTEEHRSRICGVCLLNATTSLADFRGRFWADVPNVFGFGDWEDLNRN